jgi:hypothetical protein
MREQRGATESVAECFTFFPVETSFLYYRPSYCSCRPARRADVKFRPNVLDIDISLQRCHRVDTQNDGLDFNDRAIVNGRVLPRNIFRQRAFATLDLRFVKDFTLKE